MYTHILDTALRERSQPDGGMTISEAMAALIGASPTSGLDPFFGAGFRLEFGCAGTPSGLRSRPHRTRKVCRNRL